MNRYVDVQELLEDERMEHEQYVQLITKELRAARIKIKSLEDYYKKNVVNVTKRSND